MTANPFDGEGLVMGASMNDWQTRLVENHGIKPNIDAITAEFHRLGMTVEYGHGPRRGWARVSTPDDDDRSGILEHAPTLIEALGRALLSALRDPVT